MDSYMYDVGNMYVMYMIHNNKILWFMVRYLIFACVCRCFVYV